MSNSRFPKLLEAGKIGRINIKNRIIKTAQGSSTIEPDTGFVGERAKAYYESLARGGVGLLIVESCGVEYPLGVMHVPVQFRLHDDNLIPSFSELTKVVHKHDCPIFLQLIHAGSWNPTGFRNIKNARCSSTLTKEELPGSDFLESKEMTLAEVAEVQEMFIKSAERAYKAGFDGVEINAATCHLPISFVSRVFNKRTDQYGEATLENRARFVTEIISGIRKRLDPQFAVMVITNVAEYGHPRATPLEEGVQIAKLLQSAGAEAIQVRVQYYGYRDVFIHPDRFFYPELPASRPRDLDWSNRGKGSVIPLAEAVKKAVTVPVISACRLDPILGEKLLEEGKIDFVGMTRRLLADPELPRKVMENRLEDIRPCLGCLYCVDVRMKNTYVMCRVNPQLNRETELKYEPAKTRKKVLVVGAGPSGMESARVAALRGHEVYLYDKQPKLGGLVSLAALLKDIEMDDMMDWVRWYKVQLDKLGATVRLGQEVTPAVIAQLKPEVIIAATGGKHSVPPIKGLETAKVITSADLHRKLKFYLKFFNPGNLAKLTKFWMPVGKRVIVIGGKIQGCETAEFLVKRGRQVTIVDTAETLGDGMTAEDKFLLFPWFDKKKVKIYTCISYQQIDAKGLVIITRSGQKIKLEADTIITALPLEPNSEARKEFEGKAPEVYFIGDCRDPKLIAEATASGAIIGNSI